MKAAKMYWSMDPSAATTDLINRCDEDATHEASQQQAGFRRVSERPSRNRIFTLWADRCWPSRSRSASDGVARRPEQRVEGINAAGFVKPRRRLTPSVPFASPSGEQPDTASSAPKPPSSPLRTSGGDDERA
jgi:hypothetical protein